MEKLTYMNDVLYQMMWGKGMMIFLFGSGIFLTLRYRFLPLLHMKLIIKKTIGSIFRKQEGISSFQAVSTALGGTIGVGSIVGVTTALTLGGPGALFWLWISAFFGMSLKYGETVLVMLYRLPLKKGTTGGVMYILEHQLHLKLIGVLFAIFCIFASLGIGNMVPANTIASVLPLPIYVSGIILAAVTGLCICFSSSFIFKLNEILVPFLTVLYILLCLIILYHFKHNVLSSVKLIFEEAFSFASGAGGVSGYGIQVAMRYGVSRGVFSNEAGMGSSPLAHASVENVEPAVQGFWGIFEVFIDSMVICTITGLVVLSSGLFTTGLHPIELTKQCFVEVFSDGGNFIFSFSLVFFAFSSILGWYYYGLTCMKYLFTFKICFYVYNFIFLFFLFIGSVMKLDFVWTFSDTMNALMIFPNIFTLVILNKNVVKCTQEYLKTRE